MTMAKTHNKKKAGEEETDAVDSFLGLKHIAYCRTGIPNTIKDYDLAILLDFAKWQICKTRNVLWNDPVWDNYTADEILIEFFAIGFDLNPKSREAFERTLLKPKEADYAWFDRMEKQAREEAKAKKQTENQQATTDAVNTKIIVSGEPPPDLDDDFTKR